MMTVANNKNDELLDRIAFMQHQQQQQSQQPIQKQTDFRPTPETQFQPQLVGTPRKRANCALAKNLRLVEDTAGSFIGQSADVATLEPVDIGRGSTPEDQGTVPGGKRNLSFNSTTGDVTRRSGTDSGINTSDENEIQVIGDTLTEEHQPRVRGLKRLLGRLVCCGGDSHQSEFDTRTHVELPRIIYKRM